MSQEEEKASVDEALLSKVMELGFEETRVRKALLSGASNVDAALQWCLDHENDDGETTESTTESGGPAPVAKSIKCVETGKLFRSMEEAQRYAERTGRTNFEECTEEKKALSEEEKKAKIAELKALAAKRRAEREGLEKVDEIDREKRRRQQGKETIKTKEEMEKQRRKLELERMKREKDAEKRERERLRAEIAKDKAERRARGGTLAGKLGVDGYTPTIDHNDGRRGGDDDAAAEDGAAKGKKEKVVLSPDEEVDKAIKSLSKYRAGGDGGTALKTLTAYLTNAKDKEDPKFRTIPAKSKAFRERVAPLVGGISLLKAVGFVKQDEALTLSDQAKIDNLALIEKTITKLTEAHAVYVASRT